MIRKPLLNYQQLLDKLSDVGISFDIMDRAMAKSILQERNYYYKLSSFRKLFPKENGKYNIDFAYLADLAVIDMQLRYFLLDLCLDVEHGIKTTLMDAITKNPKEDGYGIVKEYAVHNPKGYTNTIDALSRNTYLKEMHSKRHADIPIWVLIEVMDFGNLCYLVELYCRLYPSNKTLKKAKIYCKFSRYIRNATAHSNVLLVDMLDQTVNPAPNIISLANQCNLTRNDIKYRKIHDILSLVILHQEYCSKALAEHRKREGLKLLKRARKHLKYYYQHKNPVEIYKILRKIIVNLSKK